MKKDSTKQVCLKIPIEVYQKAKDQARNSCRPDGLKLLPTSVIREWILAGARQSTDRQEAYGQE